MLKPQASETREIVNLDGLYRFKVDFDRAGHRDRMVHGAAGNRAGNGRPRQLQRRLPGQGHPRPRGLRLVPARRARSARLGRGADPRPPRLRHPRGHGVGGRRPGRPAHRRLHAVQRRHHRPRHPRAGVPPHGRRQQRAHPGHHPARAASPSPRTAAASRATCTTSTTTPACTAAVWLYSTPAVHRRRHHRRHRLRRHHRQRRLHDRHRGRHRQRNGAPSRCTDADGVEVARADGASGALAIEDVVLWKPGAAYLYSLTAEIRDGGAAAGQLHPAGRRPHRRSAAARNSSSTANRSTSPASACTRTT